MNSSGERNYNYNCNNKFIVYVVIYFDFILEKLGDTVYVLESQLHPFQNGEVLCVRRKSPENLI